MKTPLQLPYTDNVIELKPGAPVDPGLQKVVDPPSIPPEITDENVGDAIVIDQAFAAVSQAEALKMELSPEQRTAIELLTSGHTLVASATAAGVSRMTLHRWLKGDAAFTAAYNAWQRDVLATARGRLLALSDLAVTTVGKSMARGDAKTALKVLQSIGALDRPEPGLLDPAEIQRMQKLERLQARNALSNAEFKAQTNM